MRSSRLEKEIYCGHQMTTEQTSRFETGYYIDYAFSSFWFWILSFMLFCFLVLTLKDKRWGWSIVIIGIMLFCIWVSQYLYGLIWSDIYTLLCN